MLLKNFLVLLFLAQFTMYLSEIDLPLTVYSYTTRKTLVLLKAYRKNLYEKENYNILSVYISQYRRGILINHDNCVNHFDTLAKIIDH